MKAIPTCYRGIEYRSRLEAKWACFFDQIGWRFTFEPFDGDGYLPDFLVHGQRPLLVEVKPALTYGQYQAPIDKMLAGLQGLWDGDVAIFGDDPMPPLGAGSLYLPAGLLGRRIETRTASPPALPKREDFIGGYWRRCHSCGKLAVCCLADPVNNAPCGHSHNRPVDPNTLLTFWARATNLVKWHALSSSAEAVGEEVNNRGWHYPATWTTEGPPPGRW
jgi:hypothetical protein